MNSFHNTIQLLWRKTAIKQFNHLPLAIQAQCIQKLEAFCERKDIPLDIKKIKGIDNCFRLRIDDYRCIFFLYQNKKSVLVVLIAHRKDVYRLLEHMKRSI